ncbi:hypothetical protein [Providencia phage PSTCR7]|uniref:Uncharacterized protein n=1 Tax=Providencia phage PSTCR7 TaxID=2783549 RepID=A0A7S9SWS2_9CAUD|nr:hypothetical protein PQD10_gp41 [Providencia phage PSTCR7]QPI18493.1 hypothetical protein [Providencia phage PSTCR7]
MEIKVGDLVIHELAPNYYKLVVIDHIDPVKNVTIVRVLMEGTKQECEQIKKNITMQTKVHIFKGVRITQYVYYNNELQCWRFRSSNNTKWHTINNSQASKMFNLWSGRYGRYTVVTVNNFKEREREYSCL